MFKEEIEKIKEVKSKKELTNAIMGIGKKLYYSIESGTTYSDKEVEGFAKDSTTAMIDACKKFKVEGLPSNETLINNCETEVKLHLKTVKERGNG